MNRPLIATFLSAACTLCLLAGLDQSASAVDAPSGERSYSISRNGSRIGSHKIRFRSRGNRVSVEHELRIRVSIAMWDAYTYEHDSREIWSEDRLVGLYAQTNKNGTPLSVIVREQAGRLRVQRPAGNHNASGAAVVAPPAWNVLARRPNAMIDAENGESLSVRVIGPVAETVRVGGQSYACQRYRIQGDLEATIWYGPDGAMVKKRLVAPDDSTIVTLLRP